MKPTLPSRKNPPLPVAVKDPRPFPRWWWQQHYGLGRPEESNWRFQEHLRQKQSNHFRFNCCSNLFLPWILACPKSFDSSNFDLYTLFLGSSSQFQAKHGSCWFSLPRQTVVLQLGHWIWIWPTNRNLSSFKLGFPGWFPRLTNCNDIIHEVAIASTKLEGRIIQAKAARCDESFLGFTRWPFQMPCRCHRLLVLQKQKISSVSQRNGDVSLEFCLSTS